MGYVEDIQKINKMARELLEHGMAQSLDEACQKAEQMLTKGEISEIKPKTVEINGRQQIIADNSQQTVVNNSQPVKEEPVQTSETPQSTNTKSEEMTWQEAMKTNNDFIIKKLNGFEEGVRKAVEHFQKEISNLKQNITNIQTSSPKSEEKSQRPVSDVEDETSHPRQGDFKPSDVSIDKMFYFGNK